MSGVLVCSRLACVCFVVYSVVIAVALLARVQPFPIPGRGILYHPSQARRDRFCCCLLAGKGVWMP